MKAENLTLLRDNGFPVPAFTVVTGETADLAFSEADRFAVRSTFDGEDTEGTSFAGQFDTGETGTDDTERAPGGRPGRGAEGAGEL